MEGDPDDDDESLQDAATKAPDDPKALFAKRRCGYPMTVLGLYTIIKLGSGSGAPRGHAHRQFCQTRSGKLQRSRLFVKANHTLCPHAVVPQAAGGGL